MSSESAIQLLSNMLWNTFYIGAPVLFATLAVGLLVSVFQVTTQLQEITLSYVPKILVAGFLLVMLGPWMMGRIGQFARTMFQLIPSIS